MIERKQTDPKVPNSSANGGLTSISIMAHTCKRHVFVPVFEVGNPSKWKEQKQCIQDWGSQINSNDYHSKGDGLTRRGDDGLDALKNTDALSPMSVETRPSVLCRSQMIPWLGFDVR